MYVATEEARVTVAAFVVVMATTLMKNNEGCKDLSSGCSNGDIGGKGKGDGNGNSDSNGDGGGDGDGDSDSDGDGDSIGNGDGGSNGIRWQQQQ